jgi:hypothetical protein
MMARHVKWVRLGAMAAGFLLAASALLGPAQAQAPARISSRPELARLGAWCRYRIE